MAKLRDMRTVSAGQVFTGLADLEFVSENGLDTNTYSEIAIDQNTQSMALKISTVGDAFTTFRRLGKITTADTAWTTLAATASDFAGAAGVVAECVTYNSSGVQQDTDITTLGDGEHARLILSLTKYALIKFELTPAGTTTVTVTANTSPNPASVTTGGSGDPATGSNQDTIIAALASDINITSPPVADGVAGIATTDAEWKATALGANAVSIELSLTADAAYVAVQTAEPTDADIGVILQPNIPKTFYARSRTNVWIHRFAAVDVTPHITVNRSS